MIIFDVLPEADMNNYEGSSTICAELCRISKHVQWNPIKEARNFFVARKYYLNNSFSVNGEDLTDRYMEGVPPRTLLAVFVNQKVFLNVSCMHV